jgi:hypothetical protein
MEYRGLVTVQGGRSFSSPEVESILECKETTLQTWRRAVEASFDS